MVKIFNVKVYGERGSLIASGYPMRKTLPTENTMEAEISENRLNVASKLGRASSGSGHDNFLKGIVIQFDITYPQYFTPQLQRYHFIDIVSSMSKMHCLTKFNIDDVCNKYVSSVVKDTLKKYIEIYNKCIEKCVKECTLILDEKDDMIIDYIIPDGTQNNINGRNVRVVDITLYELYMLIISNCPLGLELTMRCTTNLLQLKTIHQQRRNHKLKEDWGAFCDWIESLEVYQKYVK